MCQNIKSECLFTYTTKVLRILGICEIKQKSIYLHTILHLTPYNLTSYFFTTF